jgi:hypothetical protein
VEKGQEILREMIASVTMSAAASFYKFRADSAGNLALISAHGVQRSQTQCEKR